MGSQDYRLLGLRGGRDALLFFRKGQCWGVFIVGKTKEHLG